MLGEILGSLISGGISWLTGDKNRDQQQQQNTQNIELQREFAKSGIQWKVDDAKKAGIHPLAALGAQTSSFSPVSVGGSDFGSMGQDIGRAVKAAMSSEDRDAEELKRLAVDKAKLENDVLRADLNSRLMRQSRLSGQLGPAMPSSTSVSGRIPLPRPGPDRTMSGDAVREEDIKQQPSHIMPYKKINHFGVDWDIPPWLASGQALEDVGGEYGGGLFSAPNIPTIIGYNAFKKAKSAYRSLRSHGSRYHH